MTLVLLVEQPGCRGADASLARLRGLRTRIGLDVRRVANSSLAGLADALSAGTDSVALVSADLLAPAGVLLRMLDDPALTVAALVASGPGSHPVATQGSQVLSAATTAHPVPGADAENLGLVYIGAPFRAAAAAALRSVEGSGDVLDIVLTALVRSSLVPAVTAVRAEPFPAVRTGDPAAPLAAAPDRVLAARTGARPGDGCYSTFVLRPISARLTPWAVRHGIGANVVTTVSALVGVAGGVAFAFGSYPALVLGALLLQASILLDCVDGEIARATRTRSSFGGWLDAATDRVKEYAALAGLAVAGHQLWTLAAAAMVLQTVRHMQDFAFDKAVLGAWRASFRDRRPMSDTSPWQRPAGSVPGPEALRGTAGMWARRLIRMPIGERWLVLCLAALANRPWLGITAYLVLASVAWLWTLAGAIRRTTGALARYGTQLRDTLASYRDDGLLGLATRRRAPQGAAGWLLPPLATGVEGAAAVGLTALYAPHWSAAAFGWFAVIGWHRYDVVYRRGGPTPEVPPALNLLGGGWLLRAAAVWIGAVTGVLPAVLCVGIVWLALVFVPESVWTGLRARTAGSRA